MEENPYQPPRFDESGRIEPDASFGVGSGGLTEAEIRTFVGRNAEYYLRKWPSAEERFGRARGFNGAAFILSALWLPYRKMYRITLVMFGILVVENVLEMAAVANGIATQIALARLSRVFGIVFSIVCGALGNEWYLAHARREIGVLRGRGLTDEAYREALARRGGTSLLASLGMFCLLILALAAVGFVAEEMWPSK